MIMRRPVPCWGIGPFRFLGYKLTLSAQNLSEVVGELSFLVSGRIQRVDVYQRDLLVLEVRCHRKSYFLLVSGEPQVGLLVVHHSPKESTIFGGTEPQAPADLVDTHQRAGFVRTQENSVHQPPQTNFEHLESICSLKSETARFPNRERAAS